MRCFESIGSTMKRIVHLSDLHFGRTNYATLDALQTFLKKQTFELIVVSGDLTQRSRKKQFLEAKEFLDSLPGPKFIVPGNHDIPLYKFWIRFFKPFKNFKSIIGRELEPIHIDDEIAVLGMNTSSLWTSEGFFGSKRMSRLEKKLSELSDDLVKILVTHHPVPAHRLEKSGLQFDVFMSGHTHEASFSLAKIKNHKQHLKIQAGTSTSTRLRGVHLNSFNVIHINAPELSVERYSWNKESLNFVKDENALFERLTHCWQLSSPK